MKSGREGGREGEGGRGREGEGERGGEGRGGKESGRRERKNKTKEQCLIFVIFQHLEAVAPLQDVLL